MPGEATTWGISGTDDSSLALPPTRGVLPAIPWKPPKSHQSGLPPNRTFGVQQISPADKSVLTSVLSSRGQRCTLMAGVVQLLQVPASRSLPAAVDWRCSGCRERRFPAKYRRPASSCRSPSGVKHNVGAPSSYSVIPWVGLTLRRPEGLTRPPWPARRRSTASTTSAVHSLHFLPGWQISARFKNDAGGSSGFAPDRSLRSSRREPRPARRLHSGAVDLGRVRGRND